MDRKRQNSELPDTTTVSFRLISKYYERLATAANAAHVTPHHLAREILVAALESPSRNALLREFHEITGEVALLRLEVEALRAQTKQFSAVQVVTTKLLLIYVGGLTESEAQAAMEELFELGEG